MTNTQYEIVQSKSPNFSVGRHGRKIIAIVCHITAGYMPGCLSWMRNPEAQASAHYLVTKEGELYQLVKEEDAAWHAGRVVKPMWSLYDGTNPNNYTLGIEFESKGEGLTEPQYQAGLWLIKNLTRKYNIPIDTKNLLGHYRIDSVSRANDPGKNFPWSRLFNDLVKGEVSVALEAWKTTGGRESIKYLHERGLLNTPEQYTPESELAKSVPQYLFWIMLQRILEVAEGRQ